MSRGELPWKEAGSSFMFPHMLDVSGYLHVFMNALETAVKKKPNWKALEHWLRVLVQWLGTRGHRNQMRADKQLPPELRRSLDRWHRMRFDFRWEKLEFQLDELLRVLPEMVVERERLAEIFRPKECKDQDMAKAPSLSRLMADQWLTDG